MVPLLTDVICKANGPISNKVVLETLKKNYPWKTTKEFKPFKIITPEENIKTIEHLPFDKRLFFHVFHFSKVIFIDLSSETWKSNWQILKIQSYDDVKFH